MPESTDTKQEAGTVSNSSSTDLLAGLLGHHSKHHAARAIEVLEAQRGSERQMSSSVLQRRLRIGYNLACTILDAMQQLGLIRESDDPRSLKYIIC